MKQRMKPTNPVTVPRASSWVPVEQRTPAWWLFHELFHCRAQRIQLMSMEEMKEYGTPTSGDPDFDAQMRNERVDVMLPIAGPRSMVTYWDQGITIGVANEKDTKRIYELIANHLEAWRHHLTTDLNNRGAPLDELLKLDKFASVVYKHAKFHFPKDFVDSILARQVSNSRVSRANLQAAYEQKPVVINGETGEKEVDHQKLIEEQYPDRVSMADAFKRGQSSGGVTSRWR